MITYFHSDDDIARIAHGIEDTTLPKAEWTHAAHFAAALWLIRQYGLDQACRMMPAIIRRYNEATGVRNTDTSGYHETITLASLRAAAAWLGDVAGDHSLADIGNRLMLSHLGRSDWLLTYWSRELLFSAAARGFWQEPDLHPLPY